MAEHTPYERTDAWKSMDYKTLNQFVEVKMREMMKMDEGGALKSASEETIQDFQTRNAELTDARARLATLREMDENFQKTVKSYKAEYGVNRNVPFAAGGAGAGAGSLGAGGDDGRLLTGAQAEGAYKSLGDRFTESPGFLKAMEKFQSQNGWNAKLDGNIEAPIDGVSLKSMDAREYLKATMTTSAGWAPYPTMSPRPPVMMAFQQPVVADLIPQDETTQPAILYYEETANSDNAGTTLEGGLKPEATLGLTLRTQPVVKIAVILPLTDEQLMDVPQVRGYIDNRLTLMVKRREDFQLLTGSGVAPNLMGFHNKAGIGSIARAANEDNPDAVLRAITDVNSIAGFANATGIVLNPLQWLSIRLLRNLQGDYIWGHPATQGAATLWGLPVVATASETAGKGLVGDFQMFSHISRRIGIRIDVGFINDDFQRDIQRIRLEERLSLEIYRAAAFEEITNLN